MAALAPSPTPPRTSAKPDAVAPESRDQRGIRWAWILGAAGVTLAFTVQQLRDPDVWWHLAVGNLIRAHGIPSQEPFTFLGAPNPWVGQQWGYEVLLSLMMQVGAWLPMVVMGLVATLALVVAARTLPRGVRVPGSFLAASMVLSCLVAASVLGVRGQVVTVLGSAVTLWILVRWREGSTRAVWGLPPLLLVWANLHAGFVTGIAICLVVAATIAVWRIVQPGAEASARLRVLFAATAVAVVATLVNPAGVHLYPYIASTFTNPTLTQGITEWMSPNFHDWWLRLFEFEAVLMVVLWALSRRPDPVDVVLGLAAVAITLQAQRNVSLFAVVAVPQIARYGWEAWSLRVRTRPARRSATPAGPALLAAAVVAVAVGFGSIMPRATASAAARSEATRFPEAAASYVAAHAPGQRIYSLYEWGGYLAWRFPTERVVYIYGESAVFGAARLERYLDIHLVRPDWEDVLATDGMRVAIVPADSQEATAFLEVGWTTRCHDAASNAVVMQASARIIGPGPVSEPPPDPASAPPC
jgi:hypothetical protein